MQKVITNSNSSNYDDHISNKDKTLARIIVEIIIIVMIMIIIMIQIKIIMIIIIITIISIISLFLLLYFSIFLENIRIHKLGS